jgi:hypothetical protein
MALLDLLRSVLLILGILPAGLFPNRGSECSGSGIGVLFFIKNGKVLGPSLPWEQSLALDRSTCPFLLLPDGLHGGPRGLTLVGSAAPTMLVMPMVPHSINTLTCICT